MRHRTLIAAALAAIAWPAAAQAQAQGSSPEFLSRVAFHLNAEYLASDDRRFVWDADFGGELDLVDYGRGRATFVANYETILGEELRRFDPNQGNYTLAGSGSVRAGALEFAGVFHHVSRHLSDRAKRPPIDWNMLGGRVSTSLEHGKLRIDGRTDLRGVIQKSYVDYRWELESAVLTRYALRERVGVHSSGAVRILGVDGSRSRGTQLGVRGEGGVRVDGTAGALELFLAAERRIDPDPLAFSTESWITAGFRLLSR